MTIEVVNETTPAQKPTGPAPSIMAGLPEEDYHSQKGQDVPLLSYSKAKTIIQKSAYHAYLEHPLLGGKKKAPSAAMDRGSLIHKLLLGDGPEIVVIDADSFRTKDAREQRDTAQAAGNVPILAGEFNVIEKGMPRIREQINEQAPEFFDDRGQAELSIRWNYLGETPSQCRFDNIVPEIGKAFDVKTTNDASEDKIVRKILDFGYDIQCAMYLDAANRAFSEMAGRFSWDWIFIEPEDPFMVSVIRPDSTWLFLGESRAMRAAKIWRKCLESGVWPGYGRKIVTAPAWAINREERYSDE